MHCVQHGWNLSLDLIVYKLELQWRKQHEGSLHHGIGMNTQLHWRVEEGFCWEASRVIWEQEALVDVSLQLAEFQRRNVQLRTVSCHQGEAKIYYWTIKLQEWLFTHLDITGSSCIWTPLSCCKHRAVWLKVRKSEASPATKSENACSIKIVELWGLWIVVLEIVADCATLQSHSSMPGPLMWLQKDITTANIFWPSRYWWFWGVGIKRRYDSLQGINLSSSYCTSAQVCIGIRWLVNFFDEIAYSPLHCPLWCTDKWALCLNFVAIVRECVNALPNKVHAINATLVVELLEAADKFQSTTCCNCEIFPCDTVLAENSDSLYKQAEVLPVLQR